MKLFVVVKTAVYNHEIGGVFTSQKLAEDAADLYAKNDRDSHHNYEVKPFKSDALVNQDEDGEIEDADSVYSINKHLVTKKGE